MLSLNKKKILILGLGKSGVSAAKLAKLKKCEVTIIDEAENENLIKEKDRLESFGINVELSFNKNVLPECELIVTSPGIGPKTKLGNLATESGKPIISETEFAWKFCTTPLIAITGTNGKTTATEFCVHILKNLGQKSIAAGNIGYPLSEVILSKIRYDFIVLEISSFQLHYCIDFKPEVAIILNIESDHINWHGSFKNYALDKFKIYENQSDRDCLIINKNLEGIMSSARSKLITFSSNCDIADYQIATDRISRNSEKLCSPDELGVMGKTAHNLENAISVIAASEFLGFSAKEIIKASDGFQIGEHRLELVLEQDGIIFINDSKSTNPHSMMAALKAFGKNKNICLIAGGLDKEMDFTHILKYKDVIKKIFIIGKSKTKLEKLFSQVFNYNSCSSLEEAVYAACDYAKIGDIVLLSPGFASMDMFKNYIERGKIFKFLIKRRYIDERVIQEE